MAFFASSINLSAWALAGLSIIGILYENKKTNNECTLSEL